jgi:hypothetical protein
VGNKKRKRCYLALVGVLRSRSLASLGMRITCSRSPLTSSLPAYALLPFDHHILYRNPSAQQSTIAIE